MDRVVAWGQKALELATDDQGQRLKNNLEFCGAAEFARATRVGAAVTSSISEGAGLTVIEAAAAGRLVIGTPVGHFRARLTRVAVSLRRSRLKSLSPSPLERFDVTRKIRKPACISIVRYTTSNVNLTGDHVIDEWIELIETAKH
jgi:hypothetical protein